jgi:hypothetical protein
MFGHPSLFLIYEFSKISFSKKNCLPFFTISQSKKVGFNSIVVYKCSFLEKKFLLIYFCKKKAQKP